MKTNQQSTAENLTTAVGSTQPIQSTHAGEPTHPGEPTHSRRFFLTASLATGAVFVVGCGTEATPPPNVPSGGPTVQPTAAPKPPQAPLNANAWVRISPDEKVTIVIDKSEMGQGVETAYAMLAADELDADWKNVSIEFAPVGADYKNRMFGSQGTGGSTSIRASYTLMRTAGAAARHMLVSAAAALWSVEPSTCTTENGAVIHALSGKRATYGSLTEKAAGITPPKEPKLKTPDQFKLIGKPITRLDSAPKAAGKVEFGIDVRRPGMLIARVAKPATLRGKAVKWNTDSALTVKGVKKVVPVTSGIAVVAEHFWAAKTGAEALAVEWDDAASAGVSTDKLTQAAILLAKKPGAVAESKGDVEKALKGASKTIDAVYELPYQAHATMEPMTCTAEVKDGQCYIWVGTQFQETTQKIAAKITGLPIESVFIHSVYLGGGFGRRSEMDFITDAVEIAKEMPGTPIKVIWTREDDMRHDFYRPASYNVLRGGIGKDNKPVAFSQRIVSASIMSRVFPHYVKNGIDRSAVEGATEQPYSVPNWHVDYHMHDSGVPVGFWRSVGHSNNCFITESFFDEMCALGKQDPFEMRKTLLTDARLKAVTELAAQKAGWGSALEKGRGRGIACHVSFGSYVAQVAEVTVSDDGKVKVDRIVCAVDLGTIVNPNTVEAQMQSAIVYGLTATLKSAITVDQGKVVQSNFHNFKLLTLSEMPAIEVFIVPSTEKPGGAGEPATPPVAPAVTNAIFAATGKRIRKLPISAADLKK
ncbi:MAG: molybdopterin-dependent oxidoreductase [Polyangiaceae bacterium]|nr:molybdopterin-dependent oxidoreductase [Polyangiaceae bacterium]